MNASGVAVNSDLATALQIGDVVRIGVLPAGFKMIDALFITSDAFTALVTANIGFEYVDGVDSSAVPQDADYFGTAITLDTQGRYPADNAAVKPATHHAVAAASKLGGDVHVLVAGHGAAGAASGAAAIAGVAKVLHVDAAHLAQATAENLAAQILAVAATGGYTHLVAPATGTGKNVMPRVAAKLDVAQLSDITGIESADTFVRPIYAGNAFATVQSKDAVKVITVRTTAFESAGSGGSAPVEPLVQPLNRLPVGCDARIVYIAPREAARLVRLSNLGIVPGAVIQLQQIKPAAVLRVGETTLAVEPEVAGEIYVRRAV